MKFSEQFRKALITLPFFIVPFPIIGAFFQWYTTATVGIGMDTMHRFPPLPQWLRVIWWALPYDESLLGHAAWFVVLGLLWLITFGTRCAVWSILRKTRLASSAS